MGSVKNLEIIKEPKENEQGIGQFIFSDRYSVFDWGQMPDDIKDKGKALCMVGAYFFEKLEKEEIKTHYRGLVEDGKVKKLSELKKPTNIMEIDLLQVLKPKIKGNTYEYSMYKSKPPNILIPLEIIYRNSLPAGSSVFRRIKNGKLKPEDIGLDEMPKPGQDLDEAIFDFSTKLESTDRYISHNEAKEIAGLTNEEFEKILEINKKVNDFITSEVKKLGLSNEDGKIELGFDKDRNLILVDVLGTPDECRFKLDDMQLSKELARKYYRDTDWAKEVMEVKKKGDINWKKQVKLLPNPLPKRFAKLLSEVYLSFCNELSGKKWFDSPPLKEIVSELKEVVN